MFDQLVLAISNQGTTAEAQFNDNRYNFDPSILHQNLNGKEPEYALLLSQELDDPDSPTLQHALQGSNKSEWIKAIEKEFDTLWKTGTFDIVHRNAVPTSHKPISAKLHLRVEYDPARKTVQHKARFVVRGFNQRAGIDYHDIYSPVASFKSILALLAISVSKDYELYQMGFDAAFLNADIKEEVYVEPVGYFDSKVPSNHVYRLKKTLYELKQSPREWWLLLQDSLRQLGWTPTLTDNCIFFREIENDLEYLAVYVDDIINSSPSKASVETTKQQLASLFKCKDLGELSYVIGVRVTRNRHGKTLSLGQEALISKYLNRFYVTSNASTPGYWKNLPLAITDAERRQTDKQVLQSKIGALLHLSTITRPDITYEVNGIGRSISTPNQSMNMELDRIFSYLRSTSSHCLTLSGAQSPMVISTYTDADWGGRRTVKDVDNDMKSTEGTITFIGDSPVCWSSKRQSFTIHHGIRTHCSQFGMSGCSVG